MVLQKVLKSQAAQFKVVFLPDENTKALVLPMQQPFE